MFSEFPVHPENSLNISCSIPRWYPESRKLKKKVKEAKLIEELKERQYYKKPSQIRQEKLKERRRVLQKLNREQEDFRTMGVKRRR